MAIYCNSYLDILKSISLQNKYLNWYVALCEKAAIRSDNRKDAKLMLGYVEGHHVLPDCFKLGGEKDKKNIVFFTLKEHFVAHRLLTKIFLETKKIKQMHNAVAKFMQGANGYRILTSKQYEIARISASIASKGRIVREETKEKLRIYKGEKHHAFGKPRDRKLVELTRIANTGRVHSSEKRANMGSKGNNKGCNHSEETKALMSKNSKGKNKGKVRTEEQNENNRLQNSGRVWIMKDNIIKRPKPDKVLEFINDGWVRINSPRTKELLID